MPQRKRRVARRGNYRYPWVALIVLLVTLTATAGYAAFRIDELKGELNESRGFDIDTFMNVPPGLSPEEELEYRYGVLLLLANQTVTQSAGYQPLCFFEDGDRSQVACRSIADPEGQSKWVCVLEGSILADQFHLACEVEKPATGA